MNTLEKIVNNYIPVTETGCFLYLGFCNTEIGKDYGMVSLNNKKYRVHRLVYEYHNGPIPEGHVIRHKCDVPSCINPEHLISGTQADNIKDMVNRKRSRGVSGEENHLSKLTEQDVRYIRTTDLSQKELSMKYNVSVTLISNIINRNVWKHIL